MILGVGREVESLTLLTLHDEEINRIVALGRSLSFQCDGCGVVCGLPDSVSRVETEVTHDGRFRADVGYLDDGWCILGFVEVIQTSAPNERKMKAQAKFDFAYRRVLAGRYYSAEIDDIEEFLEFRLRLPPVEKGNYWFCSDVCRLNETLWRGDILPAIPDACSICGGFYFSNPVSPSMFVDWENPNEGAMCIHCAVREYPCGGAQWDAPGELIGADLSENYQDGEVDPATFIYRLGDAAFWRKVWRDRRDNPSDYDGSNHQTEEEATRRQLARIDAAFERGDYNSAARLLAPIGAPAWTAHAEEGERMLAFSRDNCRRVAEGWERVFNHIIETLPPALAESRAEPSLFMDVVLWWSGRHAPIA